MGIKISLRQQPFNCVGLAAGIEFHMGGFEALDSDLIRSESYQTHMIAVLNL